MSIATANAVEIAGRMTSTAVLLMTNHSAKHNRHALQSMSAQHVMAIVLGRKVSSRPSEIRSLHAVSEATAAAAKLGSAGPVRRAVFRLPSTRAAPTVDVYSAFHR